MALLGYAGGGQLGNFGHVGVDQATFGPAVFLWFVGIGGLTLAMAGGIACRPRLRAPLKKSVQPVEPEPLPEPEPEPEPEDAEPSLEPELESEEELAPDDEAAPVERPRPPRRSCPIWTTCPTRRTSASLRRGRAPRRARLATRHAEPTTRARRVQQTAPVCPERTGAGEVVLASGTGSLLESLLESAVARLPGPHCRRRR